MEPNENTKEEYGEARRLLRKTGSAITKQNHVLFDFEEWTAIDLAVAQLEAELRIEKQKHLDTSNWAMEQQDRADRAEAALRYTK